jgi:hypothetical protein
MVNDPGRHGVQMDVANELFQVGICVHQVCVVAMLEEMPGGHQLCLHGARELSRQVTHRVREWFRSHLYEQVEVIAHPAVRMQARAIFIQGPRNDDVQERAIVLRDENVLPMIAAKGDVVKGAWDMDSGSTRHRGPR